MTGGPGDDPKRKAVVGEDNFIGGEVKVVGSGWLEIGDGEAVVGDGVGGGDGLRHDFRIGTIGDGGGGRSGSGPGDGEADGGDVGNVYILRSDLIGDVLIKHGLDDRQVGRNNDDGKGEKDADEDKDY